MFMYKVPDTTIKMIRQMYINGMAVEDICGWFGFLDPEQIKMIIGIG